MSKMEYWYGFMDWPLKENWKCEICGNRILIWGLHHGTCRCDKCHVEYRMRDEQNKVVNVPISQLKSEYYQPFKEIYDRCQKTIDQVTDDEWNAVLDIARKDSAKAGEQNPIKEKQCQFQQTKKLKTNRSGKG